jgi:predicted enzyme related to lactoylglutathione lyase
MSNVDRHPPGTPTWFDVSAKDLNAARKFYGALFGWEFGPEGPPETGHYVTATVRGKRAAGLSKHDPSRGMPPVWSVYFASDDVDQTASAVQKGGGQVVMGPMDVMEHGRMIVLADPTGAMLGVWQPGAHAGSEVENEHGAMCWCEVVTRDMDRATKFYTGLFDLSPQVLEGDQPYTVLQRGQQPVAGVMALPKEWGADHPAYWSAYFAVDDVDASLKVVEKNGGKVVAPPFDTPYGRIAVIEDPSGAKLSIMKPAQQ